MNFFDSEHEALDFIKKAVNKVTNDASAVLWKRKNIKANIHECLYKVNVPADKASHLIKIIDIAYITTNKPIKFIESTDDTEETPSSFLTISAKIERK